MLPYNELRQGKPMQMQGLVYSLSKFRWHYKMLLMTVVGALWGLVRPTSKERRIWGIIEWALFGLVIGTVMALGMQY